MVQRTVWNTIEAAAVLEGYDEMEKGLEGETDEPKVKRIRPKGLFSQPASVGEVKWMKASIPNHRAVQ